MASLRGYREKSVARIPPGKELPRCLRRVETAACLASLRATTVTWVELIHSQACECFFEQGGIDAQAAALRFYIFQLIEGAKKSKFNRAILFCVGQRAAMRLRPGGNDGIGEKHTNRISQLAVGGDIEDELGGRSFWIVRYGRAFAHEIVLVNVALGSRIGFEAADGHRVIIERAPTFVS